MCRVIHEEPIEPVHQPEPGAAVFEPVADFLSIITLICLLGVSLGVMVLIVVLSVMGGLQKEIQGNLFAHSPHVQVCYRNDFGVREVIPDWLDLGEKLRHVPGVQSAYALIEDYALADVQGRQRPCFSGPLIRKTPPSWRI